MAHKRNSIRNRLIKNNVGICFLLETKKNNCCDSFIRNLWNIATIKWTSLESVGKSRGIIAMWDNSVFEVNSIEFGGQWISLCGTHIPSSFNCMIVGVYAASSVKERADLWEEIITLKFAFELPLVVIGDFNETLLPNERSSGNLNLSGSTSFRRFISDCELVEYNMQGHRFTWFRGGSMSRIDKAFASPEFQLQFPSLSLCRYPRGMSDHCQLLLQSPKVDWEWKPFRFINCWLSHPSFLTDFEALWSDSCKEFPGEYSLIKKLGIMGKKLRQWNKSTFGDQNLKLADIQNSITTLENKSEVCPLSETEKKSSRG
jgi:hypothetical protein